MKTEIRDKKLYHMIAHYNQNTHSTVCVKASSTRFGLFNDGISANHAT